MTQADPALDGLSDNIADDDVIVLDSDTLLTRFDEVQLSVESLAEIAGGLKHQPHDQARVHEICRYVEQLQLQNEKMYDLLVEMNNFFGSK